VRILVAFVSLIYVAAGCSERESAPVAVAPRDDRPDILLVTIDTLRADRVGAYGDPLAHTPALDALAHSGVLFREAHSVTPLTLPAHASLLTGRYPRNHGLRDNGGFRLADDVPTLAEALTAGGYATAAFVGAFVLDGAWGLERGFEVYRDPFHPQAVAEVGAFGEVELPSAEVVNAAVSWWKTSGRQRSGVPRFAWVHVYDPHTPWRSHSGWDGDPYRGEISYVDGVLSRLYDAVGTDAVIVVTSDHGEGLWDGGEREHGVLLGRAVTRVPLVVRPPGGLKGKQAPAPRPGLPEPVRPGGVDGALELSSVPDAPVAARVVETPVSGVDVAPTIAAYAEVSLTADGHNLMPLIDGDSLARPPVYAETFFPLLHFGWSPLAMAQDSHHRREEGARSSVVRWDGSPGDPDPTVLADVVQQWRGDDRPEPSTLDAETAAALEALGYLTTVAEVPDNPPDPRDRILVLSRLHAAESLPLDQRVVKLEALVREEPEMVDAAISLSLAQADSGDRVAARATTQAVLARWPEHPTALFNAAALALDAGDDGETLALSKRLLAINPRDGRGHRLAVAVYAGRGEVDQMMGAARAGLAVSPDDPNLHYLLALAETQGGDPVVGISHLEAARSNGSKAADLDLWLGVAHERAGRIDEAAKHYRQATRSMPKDPRPWAMAGWMFYEAERCEEAWPFLVNVAKRGAARDPKVAEAMRACDPKAAEKGKSKGG